MSPDVDAKSPDLDAEFNFEDSVIQDLDVLLDYTSQNKALLQKFTAEDKALHKKTQESIDAFKIEIALSDEKKEQAADAANNKAARESYTKSVKAAHDTTLTVIKSLDKLKSDDPTQVSMGVMDVLASMSQFAALTGPQGMLFASTFGPMCSIVSAVLGTTVKNTRLEESPSSMMWRVLKAGLDEQDFKWLKRNTTKTLATLVSKCVAIETLSAQKVLTDVERTSVSDPTYLLHDEVGFAAEVMAEIQKGLKTKDSREAERTAKLIISYVNLAQLLAYHQFMLSAIFQSKFKPTPLGLVKTTMINVRDIVGRAKEALVHLVQVPDEASCLIYSKLHTYLSQEERIVIETCVGQKFEGKLCFISNCSDDQHNLISKDDSLKYIAQTGNTIPDRLFYRQRVDPETLLFHVFGTTGDSWEGEDIKIFGLGAAGYVIPARDSNGLECTHKIGARDKSKWIVKKDDHGYGYTIKNALENKYLHPQRLVDYKEGAIYRTTGGGSTGTITVHKDSTGEICDLHLVPGPDAKNDKSYSWIFSSDKPDESKYTMPKLEGLYELPLGGFIGRVGEIKLPKKISDIIPPILKKPQPPVMRPTVIGPAGGGTVSSGETKDTGKVLVEEAKKVGKFLANLGKKKKGKGKRKRKR